MNACITEAWPILVKVRTPRYPDACKSLDFLRSNGVVLAFPGIFAKKPQCNFFTVVHEGPSPCQAFSALVCSPLMKSIPIHLQSPAAYDL